MADQGAPLRVLGISGLHHSVPFKRRMLPGLEPRVYRFAQGMDSAAALVGGSGVEAAAAEERFTGEKTTGSFPINAIRACLRERGLSAGDVDCVAHGFSYEPTLRQEGDEYLSRRFDEVFSQNAQLRCLRDFLPEVDWSQRFYPVPHHLAHAASAYFLSGMEDALVLVVDGMGETESLTVAEGHGSTLAIRHRVPALHSLGILYGLFTHYLGFRMGMDEYKVMGLAPFGRPAMALEAMRQVLELRDGGEFVVPLLARDRTTLEQETHSGALEALAELFGPPRQPETPLEQRHRDIAAALQTTLDRALLHVLRHFRASTGQENLCLAGGVALNCTANGIVHRSRLFRRIFVQPAAGDDGSALGAALFVRHQATGASPSAMRMPYWGPAYTPEEIERAIGRHSRGSVSPHRGAEALVREVAQLLEAGKVVAWFEGRMEFGPRALGNRSILADPRQAEMRVRINEMIKEREDFRPFAPVVPARHASRWFQVPAGDEAMFAHMLLVAPVRPDRRRHLGAVTHVDGSARVQVLAEGDHPRLELLLEEFGRRTGVPVLLNTSFNLRGQPIVCTPSDAIETFYRSKLDYLVLGDRILGQPEAAQVERALALAPAAAAPDEEGG